MKVHHLSCGTMCPVSRRLVNGTGSLLERAELVCHCLLVETSDGLLLVDTGLGTGDIADPARTGLLFRLASAPVFRLEETALHRVEALGYRREDVRHVAVTHLDVDHAGGLADFPHATVHLSADEHLARDHRRYVRSQLEHGPKWAPHAPDGERWMGFDAVRPLPDTDDEVLLVPLPGHTPGHCGVAVRADDRWLLHAGDAIFHRGSLQEPPATPLGLRLFQRFTDHDHRLRAANQERLRQLALGHPEVTVIPAHDPACLTEAEK